MSHPILLLRPDLQKGFRRPARPGWQIGVVALVLLSGTAGTLVLTGCGSGVSSRISSPQAVSRLEVPVGGTLQLVSTVTGADAKGVFWAIENTQTDASIDPTTGLFTAGSKSETVKVRATSRSDTSRYVTTAITVLPKVMADSVVYATFVNRTIDLSAKTIGGASSDGVLWELQTVGTGTLTAKPGTLKTISYTAPTTPGTYTVLARCAENPTQVAPAQISVLVLEAPKAGQGVSVAPNQATVKVGEKIQFAAALDSSPNEQFIWTASGGLIDPNTGLFTAPAASGNYQITAAAKSDPTQTQTVTVTVIPSLSLSPSAATAPTGGTIAFTAQVTGSNNAVTWSVVEAGGGAITGDGRYSAPAAEGTFTVRATLGSQTAEAKVIITRPVVADQLIITPGAVSLLTGDEITFTAQNAQGAVGWSVTGGGTINATTGKYTAPATEPGGAVVVTATDAGGRTATASVTVTQKPSTVTVTGLALAPDPVRDVVEGSPVQFNASKPVEWTVVAADGGDAGTINRATGSYIAPEIPDETPRTMTVTASVVGASPAETKSLTFSVVSRGIGGGNVIIH